jgi:LuxR family transcriptional regulator, maltose regulon positive regulatory protein
MPIPILATKLYIVPPRPKAVLRDRLVARLDEGLASGCKLTLISAPAGFGKTALVSEWIAGCERPAAWLSLDIEDSDPVRFLTYLVAALQTVSASLGAGVLQVIQSPQPPSMEAILTILLNEVAVIPEEFVLILDDYHVVASSAVDRALTFLLEHLPPQLHLVIATREDPQLPLARLRARGQLTELRAKDLRFTPVEAAEFLNRVMGLNLLPDETSALENRTEGWIAGLQLAALALQGAASVRAHQDSADFIRSFSGSHRFVLDYLVEEVLHQQPESVQTFLLETSILDRMCGSLCDAVLRGEAGGRSSPAGSGHETLKALEDANLFLVPLDNERHWYRYHHLFADLLRQRLNQSIASSTGEESAGVAELHRRASAWYEENGLELEAFQHAVAAHDVDHATQLVEGKGMPLLFRGAVIPVLNWLSSLPAAQLDARPTLWVMYASALLFVGQLADVEQKLLAAEAALQGVVPDAKTRDLVGHIASIRATVAVTQHQAETILAQSHRALEYLHPGNLPVRTATQWTLGYAYHLRGDRVAAQQAYRQALMSSEAIGHFIIMLMATLGLGNLQEVDTQLDLAAQNYRRALQLAGEPPLPVACGAHLGLARLCYEWNDLAAAEQHAQQSVHLAQQLPSTDRLVVCEVFLARLKLAQGDATGAIALLAKAGLTASQQGFVERMPEIAAVHAWALLHQGNLAAASELVQPYDLPVSQARIYLAHGDAPNALALLEPLRRQMEAKGWHDERIRVTALLAVACQASGETQQAMELLDETLTLAAPGGFVRLFVDEGTAMERLLFAMAERRGPSDYIAKLLAACVGEVQKGKDQPEFGTNAPSSLLITQRVSAVDPLSERELEVLRLIAKGLSNRDIGERLFLALDTVKGHNRKIFDKLEVQRRTEAVERARTLGLL